MGRVTRLHPVLKLGPDLAVRRSDTLAVEEPLEIRLDGESYLVTMRTPGDDIDLVHDHAIPAYANLGVRLVGAFETAMCEEAECVLLWAFPTWAAWGEFEAAQRRDPAILAWRDRARDLVQAWTRTLMVDAPLSPMRIGRQPSVEDRASWQG